MSDVSPQPPRRRLLVMAPPPPGKRLTEMDEAELRAFADAIYARMKAACEAPG